MNPSREYLQHCSTQTGYQIGPLEKVVRLGEMAEDIGRHPFLGKVLVLKGGTVLNLCFGPPKRLSVDLDFNYIGSLERAKMLEDRPRVEKAISELSKRRGYRAQRSADAHAGRKIYLNYRSVMGQDDRIEVDLNHIFRLPLTEPELREMWQPGELDRPNVRVVGLEELLVGKLLALLDRGAARDIWDVANFSAETTEMLHSRQFRRHFIALSAILDHPLPTYTKERLKGILTDRAVSEHLAPMLATREPPRSIEIVGRAWGVVQRLLALDPNEKEYIAAIQGGELRPQLLFADGSETFKRIAEHPAILWKVANVRNYLRRQSEKHPGDPSHRGTSEGGSES
jgi:predicted nucleotidyltransferase component of viral defense system